MLKLPHDEANEKALIGGILIEGAKVYEIALENKVFEDFFYNRLCKSAWETAKEIYDEGGVIDYPTIITRSGLNGSFLEICADSWQSIAYTEWICEQLREFHQRRQIIISCRDLTSKAQDIDEDVEQARSQAELAISELSLLKKQTVTRRDVITSQVELWKSIRGRGCIGLRTGIKPIDIALGGLMDSAFIVLSAEPKCGKTTLARNIMENLAYNGTRVSMLSLEQTRGQIEGAMIARLAKQSVFYLNCGAKFARPEDLDEHIEYAASLPIVVEDRPMTLSETISWGRREIAKGSKLLIVDYLQRIQPDNGKRYGSQQEFIADVSLRLANLAKETAVPLIAISSLSRGEGQLKGSGNIDYDVYAHIQLRKAPDWSPDNLKYEMHFMSQRFGPPCDPVNMFLIGNEGRLVDEATWNAIQDAEGVL